MAKLVYQRKNGKWEARYRKEKTKDGKVLYGTVYGDTEAEAIARRIEVLGYDPDAVGISAELNLLIIGAGVHGHDCKGIAESLHIFRKIKFLDDCVTDNEDVIGKINEIERYKYRFPCAFVAIGDNEIRKRFVQKLKELNYIMPSLVSPFANISSRAKLGEGIVVFPQCTINEAEIGDYSILDTSTLINSGSKIEAYTRVDCGGIVLKGATVTEGTWIKSGEIYGK